MTDALRGAVFLDRDGTVIRDFHYMGRPEQVELLPGAARAIERLNAASIPVIVVTNQSGIARRKFSMSEYERVAARLHDVLAAQGARLDATYVCPHHPDYTGPCECRKPGTLLMRRAATELGIDLTRSWFIGDKLRDVLPAAELGGRGVLVPGADTPPEDIERARREFDVAGSLDEAVGRAIESAG